MDGAQREEQAAVCVAEEEKGGCLQGMVSTVVSVLQVRTITPGPYAGGLFCCWELGRKMCQEQEAEQQEITVLLCGRR